MLSVLIHWVLSAGSLAVIVILALAVFLWITYQLSTPKSCPKRKVEGERSITVNPLRVDLIDLVKQSRMFCKTTTVLGITVAIIDERERGCWRTIIWALAYAARLDDFELQRFSIIARLLKARLIIVELPGVGISPESKMPWAQKLNLILFGSFNGLAKSMLRAVSEVVKFQNGDFVELAGYSQGVAIAASMIDVLSKDSDNELLGAHVWISRFMMIEPMNDWRRLKKSDLWHLASLLNIKSNIDVEDKFTDRYLSQNKVYHLPAEPLDRTSQGKKTLERLRKECGQELNEVISGIALRKPFMPGLLRAIKHDSYYGNIGICRSQIDIIRFNKSNMALLENNRKTAHELRSVLWVWGGSVNLTTVSTCQGDGALHHPAFHSCAVMAEVAERCMK